MERKPHPTNIKLALIGTFILSFLIYAGIFITEWFFPNTQNNGVTRILDGTLLGVIIAAPAGWVGTILAFYFATKMMNGNEEE